MKLLLQSRLVSILAILTIFLSSCSKEEESSLYKMYKVGDQFEVKTPIYSYTGDSGSSLYFPYALVKYTSMFGIEDCDKIEIGTIFEITRLEKITHSSWNTGKYSYPVLEMKAVNGKTKGTEYSADDMIGQYGIGDDLGLPYLERVSVTDEEMEEFNKLHEEKQLKEAHLKEEKESENPPQKAIREYLSNLTKAPQESSSKEEIKLAPKTKEQLRAEYYLDEKNIKKKNGIYYVD